MDRPAGKSVVPADTRQRIRRRNLKALLFLINARNSRQVAKPDKSRPRTPHLRYALRAQPVDATPSKLLIRQCFRLENRTVRLYSIRPRQRGFPLTQRSRTTFSF